MILHLALMLSLASAAHVTPTTLEAFQRWVGAVERHQPGRVDDALFVVWNLTVADRDALDEGMDLFLAAVTGKQPSVATPAAKALAELGRTASQRGANQFLKRAAVLHADAAIAIAQKPPRPVETGSTRRGTRASPLFPTGELVTDADGQFVGETPKNWNWSFARSLLDLIAPLPEGDPFVAQWYHATANVMFRQGAYGEAVAHLARAAVVAEKDPRLIYDRACLAEFNGLPVSQALLSEEDLAALRARRFPTGGARARAGLSAVAAASGVPPPEMANAEAERLFAKALALDTALAEAHIRLARLLIERSQFAEALNHLDTALPRAGDNVMTFLDHLFAGRANRALGRTDAAAERFRAALALFPEAQSALVGASHVALLRGDSSGAMDAVRVLRAIGDDPSRGSDPWWHYRMGSGYKADALWRETLSMMEVR